MSLRVAGAELEPAAIAAPQSRILLYIHGVCMHEQQLQQQGHDHGLAAAATLGYSPIHVRYNTGLHIAENGQQLSQLLEQASHVQQLLQRGLRCRCATLEMCVHCVLQHCQD